MLRFNFTRIFKSRGIDKPFSYLVKKGYSGNFATRIVNNRMETLNLMYVEKLCELFQCTPNDLLEWSPGSKDLNNVNHPLVSIKRSDKVIQLTQILNSVPLDKLNEIESVIKKEIEKIPLYPMERIRINCPNERKKKVLEQVVKKAEKLGEVSRIDGVRVKTDQGWFLVRPSGTEPVMRIVAEAYDQKSLKELIKTAKSLIS